MNKVTSKTIRKTSSRDELTPEQLQFCENYLITENATISYMRAYNNDNAKTAGVNGSKLLKKEKVTKYLAEQAKKNHSQNRIASQEDILKFWTDTMTNPEYKVLERVKASELLAKNKGMLNDKIEISHDVEINLGFDPTAMIESSTNHIIEQKHKAIEHDEYYETEYEDVPKVEE